MITVFLPTANRLAFLRSALESVALQSRRDLISKVLVSENGGCNESKILTESFSDVLPVEWISQDSIPVEEHLLKVLPQLQTEYVALLADDDIWARYHLEEAIRCFDLHPEVISFFGQTVCVDSQTCQATDRFSGSFDQLLAKGDQSVRDFFLWNQQFTAINSLAATPLNIWASVTKTWAHKKALIESVGSPVFGKSPAYDSLYIWRLTYSGLIAHGRNISLYYRVHSSSDMRLRATTSPRNTQDAIFAIRKEIERQCLEVGFDVKASWKAAYAQAVEQGIEHRIAIQSQETLDWIASDRSLSTLKTETARFLKSLKKLANEITPPVVLRMTIKVVRGIRERCSSSR
jgi:hypothetical protein